MSVAWVGAGIAAVGVISSAVSANKASHAQSAAANAANAEQQREYDQTRADQQPFMQEGYSALARMSDLLGLSGNTGAAGYGSLNQRFTPGDLTKDPGYQFELAQGTKTLQNSAAARGGLYSGATLKALSQYGNDYAGTKYNEAYQRFNHDQDTTYNRLASQAGLGQTATTTVDAAGQHTADQIGSNLIGAGNARGAADIAYGNAIGNGVNQAGAWWLRNQGGSSYNPYSDPTYETGRTGNGNYVNQGGAGDTNRENYWGIE